MSGMGVGGHSFHSVVIETKSPTQRLGGFYEVMLQKVGC